MESNRPRISYQVVEQAQDGNASMQYQLANYLYMGDENKEPNEEQGFRWMEAAAENGFVKAQKVLGLLYTNGQHAPWPAQDLGQAVYWYERAARAGDAEAMYWMYRCYDQGVGVPHDAGAARYWLQQAVNHGFETVDAEKLEQEPEQPQTKPEETFRETSQEKKPWEQYDLNEAPSERPSRKHTRSGRTHRGLREKSLDVAQDGILFIPRYDMAYVKSAMADSIIALSASVILFCILALIIHTANKGFFASGRRVVFLMIAVLITLAVTIFFFRRSYLRAYRDTRQSAWFRNTPFYKQFGTDIDRMPPGLSMQYEYYEALEKSYHPLAYDEVIPREAFRDLRGLMYMGLYFGERGACAVPDFVLVTEKGVYIVQCLKVSGRLSGDIRDEGWQLETESGRTYMIPNAVRQNEQRLRIIEQDLTNFCPWAVAAALSFHSIVVIGPDVATRSLTGSWRSENSHLLQVSPEELRSQIEVLESRSTLHEEEAKEVAKALEQIAREYPARSAEFGREML